MPGKIKILHLEDSALDSALIHMFIEQNEMKYDYYLLENEKKFKLILKTEKINIILSDYSIGKAGE